MIEQLTVIIPIHKVDSEFNKYMQNAIGSIKLGKKKPKEVLLIYPANEPDIEQALSKIDYSDLNIRHIKHTKAINFQSQINVGVDEVKTEYFSFLEFDDEYSTIWFDNVEKYITQYPDVDMFLPIISDVNEAGEFIGYSNERAWALNFCLELGYLDHDTLIEEPNFNIDGMVVKTEAFRKCGKLKESIKLSFNYEFLLRFTNDLNKILVIPKIGYKHTNMRTNSIFWNYRYSEADQLTPDEAKFWMKLAKDDFYHKSDRGITYVVNENLNA